MSLFGIVIGIAFLWVIKWRLDKFEERLLREDTERGMIRAVVLK